MFIENGLPNFLGGGDAQVWGGQLRGRVTERVSIIAPRLANLQVNQSGGGGPEGFMSAPIGFKYNLIRNIESQFLVSTGLTYFINGSQGAFSNFGNGDYHFYLTGGKQIFDRGHWLSGTGFRIPGNSNWGTQLWYWSNQWDYQLFNHIYPLVGVNWFHWMRSANNDIGLASHRARLSQSAGKRSRGDQCRIERGGREVQTELSLGAWHGLRVSAHQSHGHFAKPFVRGSDSALLSHWHSGWQFAHNSDYGRAIRQAWRREESGAGGLQKK